MTGKNLNQTHSKDDEHVFQSQTQTGVTKRNVAIALDQSAFSEYALDWAIKNVLKESDLVTLLHVRSIQSTFFGKIDSAAEEDNKIEAHLLLKFYVDILVSKGFAYNAIGLRGDPREEIQRKLGEIKADLLIIGSRGTGTLKRTFLGSLSDFLVHNADIPVIVVKHPSPDSIDRYGTHALAENLRMAKLQTLEKGMKETDYHLKDAKGSNDIDSAKK